MPSPGRGLRTSDKIALAGVLVGVLALYPAYSAIWEDDSPPMTTAVSTGGSTTISSASETTGANTTTEADAAPGAVDDTSPDWGATFRTTLDYGEGLDIDRRSRSNGQAVGVDLMNAGGSFDDMATTNLAGAPIAVSGAPTEQECRAADQQVPTAWPSIRFGFSREGQNFCVLTDQEAMATFRLEQLPAGPTTNPVVHLAVVSWN